MTVKTATDAMRRKAGAGRAAPEIGRMTPARAWKLAMPRAAQDTLGVQAAILRVDETRVVSGDLPGLGPKDGLITLIEGPEERFGIAVFDAPTLAGLIEATTTGRIAAHAPTPRRPTRTDAIISADLLDALLDGFEAGLAEMDDPPNLAGYRYAAHLGDARAMEMTLADGPFSVFRLTVDLGGGVRQGEMIVAFPVAARGPAHGRDVAAFQQALAANVMGAPTEVGASLFRFRLPLSEVRELARGAVLKVPLTALTAIEVEAGGRQVATARLGQQAGFRAVRIASLIGSEAGASKDDDFQEAVPAPAALPPADPRLAAAAFGGLPALGDPGGPDLDPVDVPAGDLSGIPDLPPLAAEALPSADFSELPSEDEGGPPDIAGLPPLSG